MIKSHPKNTKSVRGSSNKHTHMKTERGQQIFFLVFFEFCGLFCVFLRKVYILVCLLSFFMTRIQHAIRKGKYDVFYIYIPKETMELSKLSKDDRVIIFPGQNQIIIKKINNPTE
jgi:hypothetical protein